MLPRPLSCLILCVCLYLATACTTTTNNPPATSPITTAALLPTIASTAASPPTLTHIPTAAAKKLPTTTPTTAATAAPTITPTPSITPTPTEVPHGGSFVIGRSFQDLPLEAYKFGDGLIPLVFIGGMHGGYEWNTIVLAYEAIDYYTANPNAIPPSVTLYIIPSANPDGQYTVTFKNGRFTPADVPDTDTSWGRFNGRGVDLNRNWDCEWEPTGTWGDRIVSAGDAPFSEPESVSLRDFLINLQPVAVVFWHSAANIVTPSGCATTYTPSVELARLYATASGYPYSDEFSAYYITGDAADWLADQSIPAITVEFRNHVSTDWERNLAGMTAVLEQYR